MNFAPNWSTRARCDPFTSRKLEAAASADTQPGSPAELFGPRAQLIELEYPFHCVWLNTLKASARNSNAALSLIWKRLKRAISMFARPGLRTLFLPAFPNVRPRGRA